MTKAATLDNDSTTSTGDPFQDAFEAAREEHSEKEQAADTEASTETETEEDETPAESTAETQSAETTPATRGKAETGILTDAEFTALQTKHADDPIALRKSLEGAFTKKTQSLAEERRSVTRLQEYAPIIDAYEENPEATIEALAKQHGLRIVREGEATETTTETTATTETAVKEIVDEFKQGLGPELDYLAEGLAPAITKLVERLTQSAVDKGVKPLKDQQTTILNKAATDETNLVMKTFGEKHADWKDHEEALLALAQKIQPQGMTELEYLDHLYDTVTAPSRTQSTAKDIEKRVADGVKATLAKMRKGAETAETRTESTPESQIRKGPPGVPTFEDAHEAAKRGERWE